MKRKQIITREREWERKRERERERLYVAIPQVRAVVDIRPNAPPWVGRVVVR